jgi:hypothetical protein
VAESVLFSRPEAVEAPPGPGSLEVQAVDHRAQAVKSVAEAVSVVGEELYDL